MDAFRFDVDGRLVGVLQAQENPFEPGTFLLPGSSTFAEPPQIPEGHAAYFVGDVWEILRAPETMTQVERIEAGLEPLPDRHVIDGGYVRPMTPQELGRAGLVELPVLQSQLCAMVDGAIGQVLKVGFAFGGRQYQADEGAQRNANGIVTLAQAGAPVFPIEWRSGENEMGTFETLQDFLPLVGAMGQFVNRTYLRVFAAKDTIRAAQSCAEAVDVYEIFDAENKE